MWGHMFFVSSILISKDAMWTITKFFEGYFFFGRPYPGIVSFVVAGVIALLVVPRVPRDAQVPDQLPAVPDFPRPHEADAARGHDAVVLAGRSPASRCSSSRRRTSTVMLTHPALIGPFESADRVWTGR